MILSAQKAQHWVMVVFLLAMHACLSSCHSVRVVPQASEASAPVLLSVLDERPINVYGHVYRSLRDSSGVPGIEVIFRIRGADATVQTWRNITAADGSYQVGLPLGRTYQVALNKDSLNIETYEIYFPVAPADSAKMVHNFHFSYDALVEIREPDPMIFFDINKASLRPESLTTMDNLVRRLLAVPDVGIDVQGNADSLEYPSGYSSRGQYLQGLGQKRALAALQYLIKQGVPENRLKFISYGASRPAALSNTPEDRQLNRCVDFKPVKLKYIPVTAVKTGGYPETSKATSKSTASDKQRLKAAPAKRSVHRKAGVRSGK